MSSNQVVVFGSQGELRGARLFRAIGRRLAKRRRYEYEEDSTDSERSSGSSSGSGSESSRSTESLRKMFLSLSVNSRTSSVEAKREQPKRILRQPMSYAYVRGLSGLPTIRVPRGDATTCCTHAR